MWIADEILEGLEKLMSLRLSFSPAAESLQKTAETWVEVLTPSLGNPIQQIDAPRLRVAFLHLCRTCKKWPSPADLLENLPHRPKLLQVEGPPMTDKQQADGLLHLAEIKRILAEGMTP